jgi:hypothetical protein
MVTRDNYIIFVLVLNSPSLSMLAFASYGHYMIVPYMLAQNVVFDRISLGTSDVVL